MGCGFLLESLCTAYLYVSDSLHWHTVVGICIAWRFDMSEAMPFTCAVCLQHFEGYDPEGFSMWMCDYKYNDENTINYVVMNKVSAV